MMQQTNEEISANTDHLVYVIKKKFFFFQTTILKIELYIN